MEDQGNERDDVDAHVVFCDVHDHLQKEGGERDAGPVAKVREDRDNSDDSEDDSSNCNGSLVEPAATSGTAECLP